MEIEDERHWAVIRHGGRKEDREREREKDGERETVQYYLIPVQT